MENIKIELYQKTQSELLQYIKQYLKQKGVKFKEIDKQIISLNHNSKPIFVAHMDTVKDDDMKKKLIITNTKLSRDNGILGADDRAGVNLILNHCQYINFIFTRDEEIGCLGIKSLVNNHNIVDILIENNTPCLIELDRKNGTDIIGSIHGYCNDDLQDEIEAVLPIYKGNMGVYTDIDYLTNDFPCVNLSIGYYDPHSNKEYLDIKEFNYINSKIIELSNITGVFEIATPKSKWDWYDDNYIACDYCGSSKGVDYLNSTNGFVCANCQQKIVNEILGVETTNWWNEEV